MLNDTVSIVTGGSRGIGEAIVRKLASLHSSVALIYQGNKERAEAVAKDCQTAYGVKCLAYQADVSSFECVKKVINSIKTDFGRVDILVNNAGITRDGLVAMMRECDFDDVIATNLKGAFNMIRHATPLLLRAGGGKIINISSVSAIMGNAGQVNYSASKAGVIGLTKSVARELAGRNITCNAVAPGFIQTEMTQDFNPEKLSGIIPLKRMGTVEDVAEAVAFLALSSYITGVVLKVDGGLAM